jgi:hypothetical protein
MTYIMLINITMGTWLVGSRVGRDGWQWIKVILLIKPTTPPKHVYYSLFSRIWCETTLFQFGSLCLLRWGFIRLAMLLMSLSLPNPKVTTHSSTMFSSMCSNNRNTPTKVDWPSWNNITSQIQCLCPKSHTKIGPLKLL